MSIQLADLEQTYVLYLFIPSEKRGFNVSIWYNNRYNFWSLHPDQYFMETNNKSVRKFHQSAQEALDALQNWADSCGYQLSQNAQR